MSPTTTMLYAALSAKEMGIDTSLKEGTVVTNILNAVYFWAAVVAVIVLIVAGFYYVTSNNNSAQITRAKNAILGAVVGLIVIMSAYVITAFMIKATS